MTDRRWRWLAVMAVAVTLTLFVLTQLLAMAGAPVELVVALSNISLVTLVASFAVLVFVISRHSGSALWIGTLALVAEIAAALLLLIHEPQPAYLHPEWAWYWPVVNTVYFGGLLLAVAAVLGSAIALAAMRTRAVTLGLFVGLAAFAINRIAPYR
jgi:hypothetical protein